MVRQPGGASDAGGVPIASESSVVIPWNKEEGRFVSRSLPIARDHEVFIDAVEVAGEQHQKVEVDRIRQVEPCTNSIFRIEKVGIRPGADERIESVEWTPIRRSERIRFPL